MNDLDDTRMIGMLRRVVRDCGKLYRQSGTWMVRRYPTLLEGEADFVELMDDLHRGLLIKVYVTVVRADDRWTSAEKRVATEMIEHLLTSLTANDISIPGLTPLELDELVAKPHALWIDCDGCQRRVRIQPASLGRRVKCGKCQQVQQTRWATLQWIDS